MGWKRTFLVGAAAAAALVIAAGCGAGGSRTEQSGQAASTSATADSAAEDHNDADVMFAAQMIPHHEQAVGMSDVVLAKQGIDLG